MAVKKKRKHRHHQHYTGGNSKVEIPVLAERLAPLEEREAQAAQALSKTDGTIVVDSGKVKSRLNLMEQEEEERGLFGLDPVVLVILIMLLAFIAYIAYEISRMPAAQTKP
jgi:hypothetical protein